MRMGLRRWNVLLAALVLACSSVAAGQSGSSYESVKGMDERFRLDIGGFFQKFDTIVSIDGQNGHGTEVNLEDVLGQRGTQTNIRLDGYWRFGRHGSLVLGYRGWHRSNDHVIDRDVNIGDTTYYAGANVSTDNSVHVFQLYYAYSFLNTGELELGAQLGLSAYGTKISFSASGHVTGPGGSASATTGNESKTLLAPVPALGGYFKYTLLPRFLVYAAIKGLPTVTISGYSGSFLDFTAGLDYYFTKNIGLGAGYEYSKVTYHNASTPRVGIDYKYSGPLVYVTVAF